MNDVHCGTIDPSFPKDGEIHIRMNGDVKETQYYSLDEIIYGDEAGTTETDSVTDPKGSGGYSTINSKKGYK